MCGLRIWAAKNSSQAKQAEAQRDLDRTKLLSGKGVTSERQLDQAQVARDAAAAGQREAEAEDAVHASTGTACSHVCRKAPFRQRTSTGSYPAVLPPARSRNDSRAG